MLATLRYQQAGPIPEATSHLINVVTRSKQARMLTTLQGEVVCRHIGALQHRNPISPSPHATPTTQGY
jgi:hypothetical protein